jgi:CubicO group peptidase (beta-lactamase class C family)
VAGYASFDAAIQPYVNHQEFAGSILVAVGDVVLFQQAYGLANREWDILNTTDAKFRIGSISKQFTAAAVLLLAQLGQLELTSSVTKYLPNAPTTWKPISIHHLLSHTSGLPNVTALPEFGAKKLAATRPEELIRMFRDLPLEFSPGQEGRYSNSGYIVLACVVERVSGQSFEAFLRDRLLRPAGLYDTDSDSHRTILRHRAAGYTPFREGLGNADYIEMTVPIGGGSLYSTVADLHRWTLLLHRGRIIRPEWVRRMMTPVARDYGYGIQIRNGRQGKIFEHGGGIEGFNSFLQYRAGSEIVVVVLSNINTRVTGAIGQRLGDLAEEEKRP